MEEQQHKSLPLKAASSNPPHDMMRRVQIGAAGVVSVLLLVSMAGIASDRARENVSASSTAIVAEKHGNGNSNNGPLEDLGIQPVSKDSIAHNPEAMVQAPLAVDAMNNLPRTSVPDLEPDPTLERARQNKN